MSGLPAIPTRRTKRAIWEYMILWPVERVTEHLMSGEYIPEDDLRDLYALRQRLRALDNALAMREKQAGVAQEDVEALPASQR